MVKSIDIIKSLTENIKLIFPECNNYWDLPEEATYPCFLYKIGLNKHRIENYFTQKNVLNIDIIYFNDKNVNNKENTIEKLTRIDKLERELLSKYYIQVNDVKISFDYDITESDGQSLINMKFVFYTKNNVDTINYEEMKEIILEGM